VKNIGKEHNGRGHARYGVLMSFMGPSVKRK